MGNSTTESKEHRFRGDGQIRLFNAFLVEYFPKIRFGDPTSPSDGEDGCDIGISWEGEVQGNYFCRGRKESGSGYNVNGVRAIPGSRLQRAVEAFQIIEELRRS